MNWKRNSPKQVSIKTFIFSTRKEKLIFNGYCARKVNSFRQSDRMIDKFKMRET